MVKRISLARLESFFVVTVEQTSMSSCICICACVREREAKHHSLALYTRAACAGIYRSSQASSIELLLLQAHPLL